MLGADTSDQAFLPNPININAVSTAPADSLAQVTLFSSGSYDLTAQTGGSGGGSGTWLTGPNAAADYEARFTLLSGTLAGGSSAVGTWLGLGSSRSWAVSITTVGFTEASGELEIRSASTMTVLATASVYLAADAS